MVANHADTSVGLDGGGVAERYQASMPSAVVFET